MYLLLSFPIALRDSNKLQSFSNPLSEWEYWSSVSETKHIAIYMLHVSFCEKPCIYWSSLWLMRLYFLKLMTCILYHPRLMTSQSESQHCYSTWAASLCTHLGVCRGITFWKSAIAAAPEIGDFSPVLIQEYFLDLNRWKIGGVGGLSHCLDEAKDSTDAAFSQKILGGCLLLCSDGKEFRNPGLAMTLHQGVLFLLFIFSLERDSLDSLGGLQWETLQKGQWRWLTVWYSPGMKAEQKIGDKSHCMSPGEEFCLGLLQNKQQWAKLLRGFR